MYNYDEVYNASLQYFNNDDLAAKVFVDKYSLQDNEGNYHELTPDDMHKRLAKEFARVEKQKFEKSYTFDDIYEWFRNFKYIVPQGSPSQSIGNNYTYQSLGNCFTIGEHPFDSYPGIMYADQMLANLFRRRSGVGLCLDNIRPKGMVVKNAAKTTDGIAVFMERYSNTTREVAQCVAEGERVLTETGLKPIETINIGERVWTQKGWKNVINTFNNGSKDVYEITTKRGYTIRLSKEHLVFDENMNLKRIKDFKLKDKILTLPGTTIEKDYVKLKTDIKNTGYNKNIILPNELNEDLAYLLGYSYGDGNVELNKNNEPKSICLACSNDYIDIKIKLKNIVKKLFQYDITIRNGDGDLERYSINSVYICSYLKTNELLKQKSDNIIFPEFIRQSKSSVQLSFISGYLDADGCATKPTKSGIKIDSISYKFLKSCQDLLMANGVISRLFNNTGLARKSNWNDIYRLSISGNGNQHLSKKLLHESIKIQNSGRLSKFDYIKTVFTKNILTSSSYKLKYYNGADISCGVLERLKRDNKVDKNLIPLVIDSIESIINIGQKNTYDLTVEDEHMYWCEGFYIKNSGRRGATLEGLNVHHPEIETFINIKKDLKRVTGANISVLLTDEFMQAVKNDTEYEQRWPIDDITSPKISKMVKARDIWNQIIDSAWTSAEPGLLFVDNARKEGLSHQYHVKDKRFADIITNPCGEIWMGMDSCRLMLLNLFSFVKNPFTKESEFDYELFNKMSQRAQRLMDDMVDLEIEKMEAIIKKVKSDPEPDYIKQNELDMWKDYLEVAKLGKRTGLGITGLGDTLAALGIKYGSSKSVEVTEEIYKQLAIHSMISSCKMAKELGAFPLYDKDLEKGHPFLERIFEASPQCHRLHNQYGRRNISLTTTAPAGTVSTLTQTTSGIEPVFMLEYTRRKKLMGDENVKPDFVDDLGDKWQEFTVKHHKYAMWQELNPDKPVEKSPYYKATSNDIDWEKSVDIQSVAQKWISHSISKTCNIPEDSSKELVSKIYMQAYEKGCKGFTVYRDNCRSGVLVNKKSVKFPEERPKELPCDVHHISIRGQKYFVLVGLYEGMPYEVFAGKNGYISKEAKTGTIIRKKKNFYKALFEETDDEMSPITASTDEMEDCVTRLTSSVLRSGGDMQQIVQQLEKVGDNKDELYSFSRGVARALKKYIPNGSKESGECPECKTVGFLIRESGCLTCKNCQWSKCL